MLLCHFQSNPIQILSLSLSIFLIIERELSQTRLAASHRLAERSGRKESTRAMEAGGLMKLACLSASYLSWVR